jgi:hypothetical protein
MIPLVTFAARVEVGSATPGRAGPKVAPVTEAVDGNDRDCAFRRRLRQLG